MTMKNGKFLVTPSLSEVFAMHAEDIGSKLRVAIPGSIVSYDATKRTASISIGENLVLNDGTVVKIRAPLLDVPVMTIQGGGVHLGLPIAAGDECLVIFADFNIDAWHQAGGQQTPPDKRQHDISDGFAIVGPNSLAKALVTALTATEGGLATAATKVAIDSATGMVTISNGPLPANSLAGILDTMLTAMGSATTVGQVAAAATTAKASLATLLQ